MELIKPRLVTRGQAGRLYAASQSQVGLLYTVSQSQVGRLYTVNQSQVFHIYLNVQTTNLLLKYVFQVWSINMVSVSEQVPQLLR